MGEEMTSFSWGQGTVPEGATCRPLIRLLASLPPVDPRWDTLGTSAMGAETKGLDPKLN